MINTYSSLSLSFSLSLSLYIYIYIWQRGCKSRLFESSNCLAREINKNKRKFQVKTLGPKSTIFFILSKINKIYFWSKFYFLDLILYILSHSEYINHVHNQIIFISFKQKRILKFNDLDTTSWNWIFSSPFQTEEYLIPGHDLFKEI